MNTEINDSLGKIDIPNGFKAVRIANENTGGFDTEMVPIFNFFEDKQIKKDELQIDNLYDFFEKVVTGNPVFENIDIYCSIKKSKYPRSIGSVYARDGVYIILLYTPGAHNEVLLHELAHVLHREFYPAQAADYPHGPIFVKLLKLLIRKYL